MNKMIWTFLKYTGTCLLIFAIFFMIGTNVFSAERTLLHLDFQNGLGQKVDVTSATLVLISGGYVDKLPLEISTTGLDIPLDSSWLKAHWPDGVSRLKNMDKAFVFLKASGYASICSNPIHWMGTKADGLDKNVIISFPESKVVVVWKGQKLSLEVSFRKSTERFLKLTGGKGTALEGVHVKTYVYWSKSDDGSLNGSDFISEGITDATGRIPVIDGDFTYAFEITRKGTSGSRPNTVLVVRRFENEEYPAILPEEQ